MKYRYDLICSERNSISVGIDALNNITVRCPWGMHDDVIERFLDSKESWIEKNVTRNSIILAENDDIINLKNIYFCGDRYPLVISDKTEFKGGAVYFKDIKKICKLYSEKLSSDFYKRLEKFAEACSVKPKSVAFKDYRAKWGCCDSGNNIVFNFRILMLPESLQNYVAVHELCHIRHHDHSDRFWREVAAIIPDYKKRRSQLNYYSFLNSLY